MKNKVLFWPAKNNLYTASYRLRCFAVVNKLRGSGINAEIVTTPSRCNTLVLSKRYDLDSIELALKLKKQFGTRLILDICDNHFYYELGNQEGAKRAALLSNAMNEVDLTIFSTRYLAEYADRAVGLKTQFKVISDLVDENISAAKQSKIKQVFSNLECLHLRLKLRRSSRFRFLWFGNSGSRFAKSGMSAINEISACLNRWNDEHPISLTICSNSSIHLKKIRRQIQFPVNFVYWNAENFANITSIHDCCLIPVENNPFSLSKSANRLTTCLNNKIPVLATGISSYEEYSKYALLDAWDSSFAAVKEYVTKTNFSTVPHMLSSLDEYVLNEWIGLFDEKN